MIFLGGASSRMRYAAKMRSMDIPLYFATVYVVSVASLSKIIYFLVMQPGVIQFY